MTHATSSYRIRSDGGRKTIIITCKCGKKYQAASWNDVWSCEYCGARLNEAQMKYK